MNWKQQLKEMKLEHLKQESPGFYNLSGGTRMKLKAWEDSTANGLTRSIIDWITFNGGSATRISCTGQARRINGVMKFTHGTTRRGTADIHAIIKGRHASIEVKIGKDKLSEFQVKEQARIEKAGGLYFVAKDMESFIEWFQNQLY
jgi:hypothetical protein